jgi:orotidine-5'-phosphate decarboxylase
VHCSGGLEMLKRSKTVAKKINKKLKIIGVTVLTSFKQKSLREIGYSKKLEDITASQAKLAKKAKLDGIVCSGHEIKKIKRICKNMEIITPGIRLTGDKKQDQQRVMSPKQAFKNGANSIVVGRSITKGNIKKNIKRLLNSLN